VKRPIRKVETIGLAELVDFPELSVQDVPAKVDTGADNCAVWATDISIDQGVLSYTLFGPGSSFYTGTKVQTKDFRTTAVKNSSGQAEFRYKVTLLVVIGNRRIRTWFNLSERGGMTYPVLIGRNLLHNKYIVDVSKHKVHGGNNKKKNVLVLSSKAAELEDFFDEVRSLMGTRVNFAVRGYNELAFRVEPKKVRILETRTNKDLANFDLVYFKSHKRNYSKALAAAQYLQFKNVKFFDKELLTHISYDKLSEYVRLALYNLSVPRTVGGTSQYLADSADDIGKRFGWPVVCKEIMGDRGRQNFLVKNAAELRKILKPAKKSDIYIVQEYIPNDGYIRAMIFGRQVSVAVRRTEVDNANPRKQHLNNPAGSANAILIDEDGLEAQAHDLAIRAAEVMNRQVVGVDLIQDSRNKKWYILEVNSAPQLKGGSFVEQKEKALAKFIDFELNR
jgi:glutathione synthase/RimK-type ligase-like ATP-grasp enzyme